MSVVPLALATVLVFLVGVVLVARRDFRRQGHLSRMASALAYGLYLVHALMMLYLSSQHVWLLPIDPAVAWTLGALMLGLGGWLFVYGVASCASPARVSGRQVDRLVTTGAYRYSRNPQNVGWVLVSIGVALIGRSGAALALLVPFVLTTHAYLVRIEEAALGANVRGRIPALPSYGSSLPRPVRTAAERRHPIQHVSFTAEPHRLGGRRRGQAFA